MAEAHSAGKHQVAGAPNDEGNAPFRASASVTQTTATEFSILLFNVSGANTAKGMSEAQKEGIKHVLKPLVSNSPSTFIFCSDGITHPKKRVFNAILQTSSPTRNRNAAILYNQMAEFQFSPNDILNVPLLPAHLKLRQQHDKAVKEHIEKLEKYVNKWSLENQIPGAQDELRDAQRLCQGTLSLLDTPSCDSSQEFRAACLGRVAVTHIAWPHSDPQPGLRILLASWHGPHTGITREKRQEYFRRIILFIEDLRKYYHTHSLLSLGEI